MQLTVKFKAFAPTTRSTRSGATQHVQVIQIDQADAPSVQRSRSTMKPETLLSAGDYLADLHLFVRTVPGSRKPDGSPGYSEELGCWTLRNVRPVK